MTEALNGGIDTVFSMSTFYALAANVENLTLLDDGDNGTGNGLNNVLTGNAGNNVLDGGGGIDTASYAAATAGVTVFLTPGGLDTGGGGIDELISIENLTGGAFNDVLAGNAEINVLNGGDGIDTASYAPAGAGVTVSLSVAIAQNTVGGGTDTLLSFENLTGSDFNDVLTGSAGANTLRGGAGNDVLRGLSAADVLFGDAGDDIFDFNALADSGIAPGTRDSIMDFEGAGVEGGDKIDLSTIDADASFAGNQEFGTFLASFDVFTDPGQLRFDAVNHLLLGNTDFDSAAEFSIFLNGITGIVAGDFIL